MAALSMKITQLSEQLITDLRCGYIASSHKLTIIWLDTLSECLQLAKI